MKRDPGIHIRETELILVLIDLLEDKDISLKEIKKLAANICKRSKSKSLLNRSIIQNDKKIEKKLTKTLSSSASDTATLANILFNYRKKLKHRGITKIKEGSRDWLQLKELASLTVDFCNEFNLEKREGFIQYIKLALNKISSYKALIPKLNSMYSSICLEYEAIQLIKEDPTPDRTTRLYQEYNKRVFNQTGISNKYHENPSKYVFFYKAKSECEKYDVSIYDYVEAQFAGFEWRSGLPDPVQMVGEKAQERLTKYLFENKKKVGVKEVGNKKQRKTLKQISDNY